MKRTLSTTLDSTLTRSLCLLGASLAFLSPGALAEEETEPVNVLLIVLDDLNYHGGPLGGHPQAETPHIDKLAQNGVLFTNAHTNVAVCNPSRASFMTGIAPTSSGCWGFVDWQKYEVLQQQLTLGEYAMQNGYLALQTGKVLHSKKPSMWSEMGIIDDYGPLAYDGNKPTYHPSAGAAHVGADLGTLDTTMVPLSDIPVVPPSAEAPGFNGWHNLKRPGKFHYVNDDDRDLMTDELSAQWVADKLAELEADPESKPFFMAMGIIRPHTPLVVPQKYLTCFPLEEVELVKIKHNDRADTRFPRRFGITRGEKSFYGMLTSYKGDEGCAVSPRPISPVPHSPTKWLVAQLPPWTRAALPAIPSSFWSVTTAGHSGKKTRRGNTRCGRNPRRFRLLSATRITRTRAAARYPIRSACSTSSRR
jgi:hypothetical protein